MSKPLDNLQIQSLQEEITRQRKLIDELEKRVASASVPLQKAGPSEAKEKLLAVFATFAVESMSDGVFLIARDARIIYINHAACRQLGYTENELLGMTILDINPTLTMEIWDSIWGVTVNDKIQVIETEHLTKDGRIFPVEVLANYIELGGEQYSCSFTRDISARKAMELRMRQSEKMEAIGHLAGGIAHDFNNQLGGIMGYADLLRLELPANSELRHYAEAIISASRRSAALTAQLLAFARQGKYLSVSVDIHKVINETVQMLERSINKNIKITTRFNATSHFTTGDPSQLENALLNLAINARDAMTDGGELSFITRTATLDQTFFKGGIFEIKPGNYLQITVRDTGVGMSAETLKRIFEPFFTTKAHGKGTGMGLASVYGTIKNHNGAVDVHSRLGKGTEITLYLPLLSGSPDSDSAEQPQTDEVSSTFSANILLVDDELIVLAAAKDMLKSMGCRVVTANNGSEAVERYRQFHREIDLVILDLIMPEMGAKETFLQMRSIHPDIIAVISTGYGLDSDITDILELGAMGFLRKPFDFRDLAATLSRLIRQ